MFRLSVLLLFVPALLFAAGSAESSPNHSDTSSSNLITVVDSYQRTVVLNSPVRTIVSLSPGITETIFALGYGDRLVGRSEYCDFPQQAVSLPAYGTLTNPNLEMITALAPDLVVGSTHFEKSSVEKLESIGQNVIVLVGQDSFAGVYESIIRPLAEMLDDPESGERLIAQMTATVKEAEAKAASFTRSPTAYFAVSYGEGGDWTAGGDTFLGEMIQMAGARNIADDLSGWAYSLESLVHADPDIIFVPDWAVKDFSSKPVYRDLRAVRESRVYTIDESALSRQGPRMADAFASLVDIIGKTVPSRPEGQ